MALSLPHYRCSIEFERGLYFVADYFTIWQEDAEAKHIAALEQRFGRTGEYVIETTLIPPKADEAEGAPA